MNDPISRQAAIKEIEDVDMLIYEGNAAVGARYWLKKEEVIDILNGMPTINPVKHGTWVKEDKPYALYKCSACNYFCTIAGYANCIPEAQMYKVFKFCPNCGAQMEKSENVSITD